MSSLEVGKLKHTQKEPPNARKISSKRMKRKMSQLIIFSLVVRNKKISGEKGLVGA